MDDECDEYDEDEDDANDENDDETERSARTETERSAFMMMRPIGQPELRPKGQQFNNVALTLQLSCPTG